MPRNSSLYQKTVMDLLFDHVSGMHDGLHVKEVEGKGKGIFCSQNIKEGDAILTEKPIVCCQFSWNQQYNYTACDHCLKSLETAQNMARRLSANYELELPHTQECCEMSKHRKFIYNCPKCKIPFCSEECYQEAVALYHGMLCLKDDVNNPDHPINKLNEVWKLSHYPPESATVMLICRMTALVLQSSEPEKIIRRFDRFFSMVRNDAQRISHKLLGERFVNQLSTLQQLLADALPTDSFPPLNSIEGVQSLFALIGMNGQGIGTSSLSQYVHNLDALSMDDADRKSIDMLIDQLYEDIDKESGQFLNCEGSGLFQLASCTNHSCTPNAEVTFPYNNSTLVMVALEDIPAGEEVCICYLDECQRERSRHSRRKILRDNYIFECCCFRCENEADQPSETSSDDDEDEESGNEMHTHED